MTGRMITGLAALALGVTAAAGVANAAKKPAMAASAAVKAEEETELYTFITSWPAAAAQIPALDALFRADRDRDRDELIKTTREEKAGLAGSDIPYRPHDLQWHWAVVTDLPRFLSLSATVYSYTGGAHGMTGFSSMLWDRQSQQPRKPLDLFVSPAAFSAAVRSDFCAALDRQRAGKRGAPVVRSEAMFDECIDPAEQTVILGSASRKAFDRIGILIGPYSAGPYSEGSYEVTLPVTKKLLAAVKPAYRSSFAVR